MGIFTRFADIINANLNAILDKAEDPEKMIRLIIQEMEDTLVEVRTASAKTIAERKELQRREQILQREAEDWGSKAELAISRDREDLAKGALLERRKCAEAAASLAGELTILDETLQKLASEITALQEKLDDARARQSALLMRHSAASSRVKVRNNLHRASSVEAVSRFERFERKLDELDATIESQELGGNKSLADEISNLEAEEQLNKELVEMKKKMAKEKK